MLRVILVVLAMCGAARAQPKAVSVESTRATQHRHPPAGLGFDATLGWAGQRNGPSGWSARVEYELLPVFATDNGGLFGILAGFEVWRSGEDNWGGSLPFGVAGGIRLFPLRATFGVGFDAALVDQVADDTGFGLWAPFALAKLGLDVFGMQLGADARIGYRWQIGADDHARWQLGIYAGYTMHGGPRNKPIY